MTGVVLLWLDYFGVVRLPERYIKGDDTVSSTDSVMSDKNDAVLMMRPRWGLWATCPFDLSLAYPTSSW